MKIGTDCIGVGVGALIFNDEGMILLALRGSDAKNERGKWEIPGGAVEFGETLEDALKREVKEEINVEINIVACCTWLIIFCLRRSSTGCRPHLFVQSNLVCQRLWNHKSVNFWSGLL